ncbi:MAG: CRISPR system precrRNA processing endoribonuclease RAMP protein Cas6 [Oscillospiraceae bacterium]|nr:CRISPR system precrRNA processing endoribonuclease RAMP protein Cas6 [Oscillospiraceae bacterium]
MLNQIDIYLKKSDISSLYSDLGIKLHGFIMSKIDTKYAGLLHEKEPRSFSLFVHDGKDGLVCRVSTLSDEAEQIIAMLEDIDKITVYGMDEPLVVEHNNRAIPIKAAYIPDILNKNKYRLNIVTPATRKTSGRYTNPPDPQKYFGSVANKLWEYENIEIRQEELEGLFSDMTMTQYYFENSSFSIAGKKIPSMIGGADISLKSDADTKKLKLLLGYATYSGIGAKTALGMGGFLIGGI